MDEARYAAAGVDIDAGNRMVELIKPLVRATARAGTGAEIGEILGLRGASNHHADRLVRMFCRRDDTLDRILDLWIRRRFHPERNRQIAATDEQPVDAVDGGDLVDMIERLGVLDHRNHAHRRVLLFDQLPHRRGAVSAGARRSRIAPASAAVAGDGGNGARLLDRSDMRHQHTGRAAIKTGQDLCRIVRRHPHDAGEIGRARRQHDDIGDGAIERRMLLVDHDKIVPQRAEDFGGVGGRCLDETADQILSAGKSATERRKMRLDLTGQRDPSRS